MNKLLGLFAVTMLTSAVPDTASAQCGSMCMRLVKENGEVGGHGCATALNNDACVATVSRCTVSRCVNALLTTPEGRVVGELACSASESPTSRIASALSRIRTQLAMLTLQARVAGGVLPVDRSEVS
jgi:hypothetical protein